MSDLTKCGDKKCPSRFTCYRYTVAGNPQGQSYADFQREEDGDKCQEGFIPDTRPKK